MGDKTNYRRKRFHLDGTTAGKRIKRNSWVSCITFTALLAKTLSSGIKDRKDAEYLQPSGLQALKDPSSDEIWTNMTITDKAQSISLKTSSIKFGIKNTSETSKILIVSIKNI